MSTLHVSCAVDDRYVEHSAAMLHSVLGAGGGLAVHVHYLHGPDLPDGADALMAGMVERLGGEISFLPIPADWVAGLPTTELFPSSPWYRTFLPPLLPDVDRLLYLDVDVIVTDSLAPLWETDLSESWLGAVTNVCAPWHRELPGRHGIALEDYFNSGVLLMNLDAMRRDGVMERVQDYGRAPAARSIWPDQDALNVVLGSRRVRLHPRWNVMNSVLNFPESVELFGADAVAEARRRPAIRHFEGPDENKPWHYRADPHLRELYLGHRRETPWPRFRPEGATPWRVVQRAFERGRQALTAKRAL